MKLKIKHKELPPVQMRLVLPAALKADLDRYVAFVAETSQGEVEAREVAVQMLEQFMASDREFRQWQTRSQESVLARHEGKRDRGHQLNGHGGSSQS